MKTISPRGKYVLLAEEKTNQTTSAGGIILEGAALGKTKLFIVADVGPSVEGVTEGDRVIIKLNDALPIDVDGFQRLLVPEENILAVVK